MVNQINKIRKVTAGFKDPVAKANIDLLSDRPIGPEGNPFTRHALQSNAQLLWQQYRNHILINWENENTRPQAWYLFDCHVKPPFFLGRPGQWAMYPELIPSEKIQKAFLYKLGFSTTKTAEETLLTAGGFSCLR